MITDLELSELQKDIASLKEMRDRYRPRIHILGYITSQLARIADKKGYSYEKASGLNTAELEHIRDLGLFITVVGTLMDIEIEEDISPQAPVPAQSNIEYKV